MVHITVQVEMPALGWVQNVATGRCMQGLVEYVSSGMMFMWSRSNLARWCVLSDAIL